MTPTQKIKWLVLAQAASWAQEDPPPYPCANVDELYDAAWERDELHDAVSEARARGEDTDIEPKDWHGHYDRKSKATQLPDGTWVGWTYWYGGGKHGSPGEIEWMEDAYDVTMREETRVVRVFAKPAGEVTP